ncbi:MAG: hypothetical protein O2856_14745, partial [Planctomycetota bacterium]|nr:hypothetical protein [Planctomycetota bacterium]
RIGIDHALTENYDRTSNQSPQERYLIESHCRLTSAQSTSHNHQIRWHMDSLRLPIAKRIFIDT